MLFNQCKSSKNTSIFSLVKSRRLSKVRFIDKVYYIWRAKSEPWAGCATCHGLPDSNFFNYSSFSCISLKGNSKGENIIYKTKQKNDFSQSVQCTPAWQPGRIKWYYKNDQYRKKYYLL